MSYVGLLDSGAVGVVQKYMHIKSNSAAVISQECVWYISLACATATIGAAIDAQCSYDRANDEKAVGAATDAQYSSNR
jgi:hypothetical protein